MSKPHTYAADLTKLPKALHRILALPRFVVWRWEWRLDKKTGQQKLTKPPYQPANPSRHAKSNDPTTWGTYEQAVRAVCNGHADGIGVMLKDSELGAVDVDHVRDPATGELLDWARTLCEEATDFYQEVTVSGCGLRFIGLASGSEIHRKFTFDHATGAAIEVYRSCARFITISGLQIGTCEELIPIDDFLDTLVHRFDSAQFDLNTAGQQFDYLNIIQNGAPEGERSEAFQKAVWHLAGQGMSPDQIAEELAKHPNGIGSKYATRLLQEVERSFAKWHSRRRVGATAGAMGTAPTATGPAVAGWPQIFIRPGELPRVVDEAESALLLLGREIYQRGGLVVRPVLNKIKASDDRDMLGWQLTPVSPTHLVEVLTCAAQFLRYDNRTKAFTTTDAPKRVAETYLARQGSWRLPILTGIVHTPFLRPDGSLCETPGYDQATGLLFKPDGQTFPPIPQNPSRRDAQAALEVLEELTKTFPFVTAADWCVALSAILTMLDRRSMATAPLHAFTARAAGTGKSMLVDISSIIATGRLMPVISLGKGEEELEKRLGAALLAGDTGISIDNCEATLSGAFLCQALTQPKLNIRLLGYSQNVETPVNATLFATGNNLEIAGDLIRRCLLCSMDAKIERPELRIFAVNAIQQTYRQRGELVTAALTILRAWHVSGDVYTQPPLGGFEEWSRRVRGALLWLDCVDPCDTIAKVRGSDPKREALVAVIEQWHEHLGESQAYTVRQVIERAINVGTFHTALMSVAEAKSGGVVSNERLGRWLKRVEGEIVNKFTLLRSGTSCGYSLWKLSQR
jgi:hypothetical protein